MAKRVSGDESTVCIIGGCKRSQKTRGLCWPCYQRFRRAIWAREITDDAAVKAGLVLKRKKEITPSPWSRALSEAKP